MRIADWFASMNKKRFVVIVLALSVLAELPKALHGYGFINAVIVGFLTGVILLIALGFLYGFYRAAECLVNLIIGPSD
jgi:hypothetical protein